MSATELVDDIAGGDALASVATADAEPRYVVEVEVEKKL